MEPVVAEEDCGGLCCWQLVDPKQPHPHASCCCFCCAPRGGLKNEAGEPLPMGKWLPSNDKSGYFSVETASNYHRILCEAIFCPAVVLGQLWHNAFAKRSDLRSHGCCACPYSKVCILLTLAFILAGVLFDAGFFWVEWRTYEHSHCWQDCEWRTGDWGIRYCHRVTRCATTNIPYPAWVGWRLWIGAGVLLLCYEVAYLTIACIVRIQIRKRDRIPERYTGQIDAGCCLCTGCTSCSCCEDACATWFNPCGVPLELAKMLNHIVHASKHERYVECSPYGTHVDDDIEAGGPLLTVVPSSQQQQIELTSVAPGPQPDLEPMNFTIHKATTATKVGIAITQRDRNHPLKIESLAAGGLAAASGLMVGDTVQTINGRRVTGASAATDVIKGAVGDVVVGIARAVPQQAAPKFDPMTGQRIMPNAAVPAGAILAATFESGPLGLGLSDKQDAVVVTSIAPGGLAANLGLTVGLVVISVNDINATGLGKSSVLAMITQAGWPVTVRFRKNESGDKI